MRPVLPNHHSAGDWKRPVPGRFDRKAAQSGTVLATNEMNPMNPDRSLFSLTTCWEIANIKLQMPSSGNGQWVAAGTGQRLSHSANGNR
jgi:hypothetical protein